MITNKKNSGKNHSNKPEFNLKTSLKNIKRLKKLAATIPFAMILASCARNPGLQDGAPTQDIDVSHIQNPTPHYLPKSRYGNPKQYTVLGVKYKVLDSARGYDKIGIASWYGTKFHGKLTSTREVYNLYSMTAASKVLPLPCYARVTNLDNGHMVIVKVNDRGPFKKGRIIDLSYTAAKKLGMMQQGTAHVEVRTITDFPGAKKTKQKSFVSRAKKTHQTQKTNMHFVAKTPKQKHNLKQIGAFHSYANAKRLAKKLHSENKEPLIINAHNKQKNLYRVYVKYS